MFGDFLRPDWWLVFVGAARQAFRHDSGATDAVNQSVVNLDVSGKAAAGQTLDHVGLPQGAIAVHQIAMQARHHGQQFADAARLRQGQMAQVVVQLKLRIFFPIPKTHAQHGAQIEGSHSRQVAAPFGQQRGYVVRAGVSRWRVNIEAGHVHWLIARFHPQECGVRGTECLHGLASFGVDR